MPNITFVLPHWAYWSGLLLFPLVAMLALSRANARAAGAAGDGAAGDGADRSASHTIAYFLLVTAGFVGMHRLYLRNLWGLLFVPVFVALLLANAETRASRDGISRAANEVTKAEFLLERAQQDESRGKAGATDKAREQQNALEFWRAELQTAEAVRAKWTSVVRACALAILAGLLFDLTQIPRLKRRCDELDKTKPSRHMTVRHARLPARDRERDIADAELTVFARLVGRLNHFSGAFVAYWSVIAVFVYYYEVLARYVFNSPTNWAHESMFLMFGAQYLLAGGFCLREDAHVRVDVFYTRLSQKQKALVDVITSVFFFIFMLALLDAGWTFFLDSYQVREVSFTEWGIQYYPIKLTLAAGAALLLLQGVARLLRDLEVLRASAPANGASPWGSE